MAIFLGKIMSIKDKLIDEYPLTKKIECSFDCFEVCKRRYVIFFDKKIKKNNIESLLDDFNNASNIKFSKVRTLIIVGHTDEQFNQEDLVYFNGVDTFVVYYLLNDTNNEIYFNNHRVFFMSVDWKKIKNRFNKLLKNFMGYNT